MTRSSQNRRARHEAARWAGKSCGGACGHGDLFLIGLGLEAARWPTRNIDKAERTVVPLDAIRRGKGLNDDENLWRFDRSFQHPGRGGAASSLIVIMHGWVLMPMIWPIWLIRCRCGFWGGLLCSQCSRSCSMNLPDGNGSILPTPRMVCRRRLDHRNSRAGCGSGLGIGMDAVALKGFSQGGMMSLHCGLHMSARPRAVVSFSGALGSMRRRRTKLRPR